MSYAEAERASYEATVTYHHSLVQVRFSVASFFMTAAAFLVAAHFAETKWKGDQILLPILGILITIAVWIMELRTRSILANLVATGLALENVIGVREGVGFFHLMSGVQPIGVRIPFWDALVPNTHPLVRRLFSHTMCLNVLYLSFLVFWVNAAWIAK